MAERSRDLLGGLAALALGLAAFFVLIGWPTLIPTNIAWLDYGDRAMHQLGWMFFRETGWHMPPGLSPDLGIELSSSIGLVDGLPLFALPLKLIAAWLPQPFQYWGDWLLLSFALQSLFAYAIAREFGVGRVLSLVAAGFVLITPAFMFRISMHLALSGHWTILAALYLYVRREPPKLWMWPLLATLTAAIHAYLLVMVLGLWLAALVERLWSKRIGWGRALVELVLVLAGANFVLWAAGFFLSGSTGTYGYGDYKLNLLWPFLTYRNWSTLFPDLPHTKYDYEGLSFLGIGVLALLLVGLLTGAFAGLRSAFSRRWLPLAVVLVLLMLFAYSKNLSIADVHLATLPMPKVMETIGGTLRSTGRFVWPLLYLITIGAVVLLARKLRPAVAIPIALVALAVQTADSAPQLISFANRQPPPGTSWGMQLPSPFWERAVAAGYTRIRAIPIINPGKDWKALGYFAVMHGMDVDSAYLGRNNDVAMAALRTREAAILVSGEFEPHTLYELDIASAMQASTHIGPDDLLAIIDQRIILAKGGAKLVDGLGIAPHAAFN